MNVSHSSPAGASPQQRVQASFERQGMMRHLGVEVLRVVRGECVLTMPYSDKVTQQHGMFHGGAMGALADIAAGYAALTVTAPEMEVLTVEYKINFLTACQGGELCATGRVVKAGKRLIVTRADVTHVSPEGQETLCAVLQQTIMPVASNKN